MSGIKKLAGQTLWYGASSIAARFLNYLLTPYLTYQMATSSYGEMSILYAAIPFLNVIFTYGLETAYFRYATTKEQHEAVYNTATISLIFSTSILTALLILFNQQFADLLRIPSHPEFFTYSALIIAFDALTTLAFARLRYEGRPVKFASVRIAGIIINLAAVFFLLSVCPRLYEKNHNSFIHTFYNPDYKVGYVIIANLVQSVATFILLSREFFSFKWQFNGKLWKEIILYSSPLILAGFAGMINETFDRIMLGWWSSAPTAKQALAEVGIYGACYKLSILITLFIQAFRMGAEPFFFKQAQGQQPQKVYARVMKFFVIVICFMFLLVVLFLDIWKYFVGRAYWSGLKVVPILLLANMFLGIYYNLSIWYKLSNKTIAGAWITLIGATITLVINYLFIPRFSYMACAWATFLCYGSMMVVSFVWGQKAYRVPYAWKKLVAYIVISVAMYGAYELFHHFDFSTWANRIFAVILLSLFALLVGNVEKKELQRFPYVGRLFTPKAA
ncbi:MAG: oligosaccharide flippase family protein [Flavisolibacter sp.]